MSGSPSLQSRPRVLIALLLVLSLPIAGCSLLTRTYPEQRAYLVWEAGLPGVTSLALLLPKDTGAADVIPQEESGILPVVFFDTSGLKVRELDLSAVAQRNSRQTFDLPPTAHGWVGLDYNHTWEHRTEERGDGTYRSTAIVYLDTVVKLVNRDGVTVWETPGLASAVFFHIDDSLIGCSGKVPSVLLGIPGPVDSPEYVAEVVRRYESAPTRVQLLDTATGHIRADFELPAAGHVTPIAVIHDAGPDDMGMVLSSVRQDRSSPISGFTLSDVVDGHTVRTVDFRTALPVVEVDSLTYAPAGLVVSGYGNVTLMDLEGRVRWTAAPKGVGEKGQPAPQGSSQSWVLSSPDLRWSSTQGQIMITCPEASSYYPAENVGRSLLSVSVFGATGTELLYQRDLNNMFESALTAARVVTTAEGSRVGEDYLYVFDVGNDAVTVSRAIIPTPTKLAVSPSGEYVLTLHRATDSHLKVRMYRLEGVK